MAEIFMRSRPNGRCIVKNLKTWLVAPIVFPVVLIPIAAIYAVFREAG